MCQLLLVFLFHGRISPLPSRLSLVYAGAAAVDLCVCVGGLTLNTIPELYSDAFNAVDRNRTFLSRGGE